MPGSSQDQLAVSSAAAQVQSCSLPYQLFVVGGYRQLTECHELVINRSTAFSASQYRGVLCREARSKCRFERLHHSICAIDSKSFIVTGSLQEESCDKCEVYNVEQDKWTIFPAMNKGKQSHSSCCFNQRYVYVFGAYMNGYLRNTVECLDVKLASESFGERWRTIEVAVPVFAPRYKSSVFQISRKELCIVGGQDFIDCHLFEVKEGRIRKNNL